MCEVLFPSVLVAYQVKDQKLKELYFEIFSLLWASNFFWVLPEIDVVRTHAVLLLKKPLPLLSSIKLLHARLGQKLVRYSIVGLKKVGCRQAGKAGPHKFFELIKTDSSLAGKLSIDVKNLVQNLFEDAGLGPVNKFDLSF